MIFYRGFFSVLLLLAKVFALFSAKVATFVNEREQGLTEWLGAEGLEGAWWFHVSSVGELEQARPVLEALKARGVGPIVLTYFSPSVPRLVRDWSFVDRAGFAPLDSRKALRAFVEKLKPHVLVLNRYDLWPEMLAQAKHIGAPVALINASTPPLGFWGGWGLQLRRGLFVSINVWTYVDAAAATAWEAFALRSAKGMVTGNPRVDRVLARVELAKDGPERPTVRELRKALAGKKVLVAGSTWPADELLLFEVYAILKKRVPASALVVVPHEPSDEALVFVENAARKFELRLQVAGRDTLISSDADIYFVSARGYLAEAYGLGHCAYVGGGFTKHVHSVIEPLAHALPVALGPKHSRAPEVSTLAAMGAAFVVQDARQGVRDLAEWVDETWKEGERLRKAKEALELFTKVHRGSGERIAAYLVKELKHE